MTAVEIAVKFFLVSAHYLSWYIGYILGKYFAPFYTWSDHATGRQIKIFGHCQFTPNGSNWGRDSHASLMVYKSGLPMAIFVIAHFVISHNDRRVLCVWTMLQIKFWWMTVMRTLHTSPNWKADTTIKVKPATRIRLPYLCDKTS